MQNRSRLAGIQYLIMMTVWIVVSLLVGLTGLRRHVNYYTSASLILLALLIPVVVMLVIDRFEVMRGTRMKTIGIKVILWTMLLALLLIPVVDFLNLASMLFVPNEIEASTEYYATVTGVVVWEQPLLLNLFYIAILPAVVEEFIFRGVLFQCFRSCGLIKTAFFTALLFALAHGNMNQFLYAFVLGIFLAYLTEASGSVFAPMLLHALINMPTVILFFLPRILPENLSGALMEMDSTPASELSLAFWIICSVIAGVCVVLAIIVIRTIARSASRELIYQEAKKGRDRLKGKEGRVFSVELLIGMLIPIIYMAITLVAQLFQG